MKKALVYIHGKGGSPQEAEHYKPLFENYDVLGFYYLAQSPWEAKTEFSAYFDAVFQKYETVSVVANSIGAYFTIAALSNRTIEKAYFISPIVNMEKLISDMMLWANVTLPELQEQKEIETAFGETLSWEYLCYVKEHPVKWAVPTHILYGENDNLTSFETISAFAKLSGATLTVMKDGEHWFHTEEQMQFLDDWLKLLL